MPGENLRIDEAVERIGDRALYLEIARFFADAIPETRASLGERVQSRDWQEARRLAHSLKSNCAGVGAEETRDVAYKLEIACRDGDGNSAAALFDDLAGRLDGLRKSLLDLK